MVQAWTEDSQVPLSENPEVKHMPREQQAHSVWLRQHREHPLALLKVSMGDQVRAWLGPTELSCLGTTEGGWQEGGPCCRVLTEM